MGVRGLKKSVRRPSHWQENQRQHVVYVCFGAIYMQVRERKIRIVSHTAAEHSFPNRELGNVLLKRCGQYAKADRRTKTVCKQNKQANTI